MLAFYLYLNKCPLILNYHIRMNNNEQIINKLYIYYRINNPKTNNYYSKRNTHRFPVTELSHTVLIDIVY